MLEHDYRMSEQLFIDLWTEFGSPDELYDKKTINEFLIELVKRSDGLVVLDHYSLINFDRIERIEVNGNYTSIVWRDFTNYYTKRPNNELSDHEDLTWNMFGYSTVEYIMLDIAKLKFVRLKDHIFLLIQSNYIQKREVKKIISKHGEIFNESEHTDEMYSEYLHWKGDAADRNKYSCIVSALPYYTCIVQPKEHIPPAGLSKDIMLVKSITEAKHRLSNVRIRIEATDDNDYDWLFCIGNLVRRIMEFSLKYFCVIKNIEIDIDQKYKHISIGDLKKATSGKVDIPQSFVNDLNAFSHDSGYYLNKEELHDVLERAMNILDGIASHVLAKVKRKR